jgi:hypothetical protein
VALTASRAVRAALALAATAVVAAAVLILATHGDNTQADAAAGPTGATGPTSTAPLPATKLTRLPHATLVNGTTPIIIRLNGTPSATTTRPWFSPHVNGTWTNADNLEIFTPASTMLPCQSYTLVIPANTVADGHSRLGKQRHVPLSVSCGSVRGLQIALARLDYLPYHLHPDVGHVQPRDRESRQIAASQAFDPPSGRLISEAHDAPPVNYGDRSDPTTTGALEVFQADHNIPATGTVNTRTWESLLAAEADDRRSPEPYTWVTVTETIPETLEVHRGHHVALSSPANTGVPGAETAQGVFPIFSRFVSTTMTGTNPDGSHYSDPGVPWVNYFNGGDAVHGFPRGSYGSPQSNGCVELPISTAAEVYPMLRIGDIVWVQ